MDARKRPARPSRAGIQVCRPCSFLWQPSRVLIVDVLPPWWLETGTVFCEALDNFLSLACSLEGPCRIPLLSVYAISRQQECLMPFVSLRGNLGRLRSCVEELRSMPGEGCIQRSARGRDLLRQAVLDSMQQFKHYTRLTTGDSHASRSLEITVVTSQPDRGVLQQLGAGLKDTDLLSLRRLLVVQISTAAGELAHDTLSPGNTPAETNAE
ncbi:meiosis 1 arrest protein [Lampris incognitus]|uniref:meiosis 1 arrest protein n=1 Tax=Lampris incognitus TaxID=2546036 RepID=UPI0024B6216A|nr:meiosis 1 arrest protein [Lampris incognitus]